MKLSEKATNLQKEPPGVPSVEPMLVSGRNCPIVLHGEIRSHSLIQHPHLPGPSTLYLPYISLSSQNPALLTLTCFISNAAGDFS